MNWRFVILLLLLMTLLLVMLERASAHSWYESSCCSGQDCRPMPVGTVKITPQGYELSIPDGPVVKISNTDPRIRMIPISAPPEDRFRFHVCTAMGRPSGTVLCVYVPEGGV